MLRITVPARKSMTLWDERDEQFVTIPGTNECEMTLEHSLDSLSKWEMKWCKSFLLNAKELSDEESIDYIRCMTLTENVPSEIYSAITDDNIKAVTDYINAPMTATWFSEDKGKGKPNREVITAELIYYWMISLNIPFECQHWHLNKLLTLIRVCDIKNQPPKKMGKKALMSRNAALNAARKKQLNSNG